MERVIFYLRLYLCYLNIGVLKLTQYPLDTFIMVVSLIIREAATFLGLITIANVAGGIGGWTMYELCLLFGMGAMIEAVSQSFFDTVWSIGSTVRKGGFDIFLIRPAPIFLQLIGQRLQLQAIFSFLAAAGLVGFSFIQLQIPATIGNILFLAAFLILGTAINTSIYLIFNSLNFWVIQGHQIAELVQTMREFSKYPLHIFPVFVKAAFSYLIPFGFVGYYPAAYLVGKEGGFVPLIMPVLAVVLCSIGALIWKKGIGSYDSTGT